jgi:DNA-binding transcriptional ArsR family regulator
LLKETLEKKQYVVGYCGVGVVVMAKHIMVAIIGAQEELPALFVGIREFPVERVYLIATRKRQDVLRAAKKDLEKFQIPASVVEIQESNLWEEIFRAISEIKSAESGKSIMINVATGDKGGRCAATSAAFVNGLKAFDVVDNELMLLPVLKFSYYKQLTDKKMDILKILNNKDCCSSLEMLGRKSGMSLPLISYHINGNLKSEGLKDLGLVETAESKGRMEVRLTTLGKLLIKGYVS